MLFVSISLLRASFKFFGKGFAEQLVATTANPVVGLFIGVLATSLVQSSSTVTSMTVGLVAGRGLDIARAIPIIMGSNIGTSVTNAFVSIGHIYRSDEIERAFAAVTVHDFFTLLTGLILLPLQLTTNFLGSSHPKRLQCGSYEEQVQRIETAVSEMFDRIVPTLKSSDKAGARTLIADNWWIRKLSAEIDLALIEEKDKSLSPGGAVSVTLYVRYLKRIAAHLMNVLSGVVNPFERIGFRAEEEI